MPCISFNKIEAARMALIALLLTNITILDRVGVPTVFAGNHIASSRVVICGDNISHLSIFEHSRKSTSECENHSFPPGGGRLGWWGVPEGVKCSHHFYRAVSAHGPEPWGAPG